MTNPTTLAPGAKFQQKFLQKSTKWLGALVILASPWSASAQTWAGNRQRPSLREIATVDRTGETGWLWGREDVAGDGLDQFSAEEQAIDVRSVYLRVDDSRLWWRTYVSATEVPSRDLTAYLFIDFDLNTATGRTAAATELEAAFVDDPTAGGYEYVVAVSGDGTPPSLWGLDAVASSFVPVNTNANELTGEIEVFRDPLRIGQDERGYVQASMALDLVSLTSRCDARFFVRTTNKTQGLGEGDLDVGDAVRCAPEDTNSNRVPDIVEPTAECQTDAQCPNGGICWEGRCWVAPACIDDTDCPSTHNCIDGSCIVRSGTNCTTNSDCPSGLCVRGECVICNSDDDCGPGRVCGPDARCVDEDAAGMGGAGNSNGNNAGTGAVVLADGERIQGGACACRFGAGDKRWQYSVWLGLAAMLGVRRLRRQRVEWEQS